MRRIGRFWSSSLAVVATVTLAFLGVIGSPDQELVWVIASVCAVVVVLVEVVRRRQEKKMSNRLGKRYEEIVGSVLHLIADLADLTAHEFGLWVIDLYVPRTSFIASRRACTTRLERSLSIALTDVRTVPGEFALGHPLFGCCFTTIRPRLWWNIHLKESSDDNEWCKLDEADNNQLRRSYGAVSANPVSNRLGMDCRGLLVIHAGDDAEIVTKVLGALRAPEGQRRVTAACRHIHGQLVDL